MLNLGYGSHSLKWTILTQKALPIGTSDAINPTHASMHGLISSMAKEYPIWEVRLVDFESDEDWPMHELFALPVSIDGDAFVYRSGQWYTQKLVPFQRPLPVQKSKYRHNGVYVVIGGASGIGAVWSEVMIRNYQAQIIWIGRRAKDTTIQSKIDQLSAIGPTPEYISADATDRESLQSAYEKIKQRHSKINGIVHSAIVLLDHGIFNMTEEQFHAALSTKVDVSVRMAQVFTKEPLDFVLFFPL